ncbi:uncharacterized protein LOC142340257 [Convolutriloba macropyga]|uniref:uncharacterized protein LOC142340257 n=1 Tax=Convolutriloba macropyga TaxID=536237 RepID=UPI003F527071
MLSAIIDKLKTCCNSSLLLLCCSFTWRIYWCPQVVDIIHEELVDNRINAYNDSYDTAGAAIMDDKEKLVPSANMDMDKSELETESKRALNLDESFSQMPLAEAPRYTKRRVWTWKDAVNGRRWTMKGLQNKLEGEEFTVGLFGFLTEPWVALVSVICPCFAEFYVGWVFKRRAIGTLMFLVTLLMMSTYCVFWIFEINLKREEHLEEIYSANGIRMDQKNLKYLKTWSLVLYLIFLSSIVVRFVLYLVMRMQIRTILGHMLKKNPDICNKPDCFAVFWCSSCVLCQHTIEARDYGYFSEDDYEETLE